MDVISYALAKKHTNEKIAEQKLKVAKVEHELNDLKGVLQQVNINQEATQSVSGYGIVSLPKNAANGQVSDVKIKGLTATNIINNGNFANGTSGWQGTNATISVSNNIMQVVPDGSADMGWLVQNTSYPIFPSRKYFVKAKLRVTNNDCVTMRVMIRSTGGSGDSVYMITAPVANQWYSLAIILDSLDTHAGNFRLLFNHEYADAATANGKIMEVQEVMAIDLTAHGLESKTVEELAKMFANYFDGTKSTNSVRVKSVGKNLFDLVNTSLWEQGSIRVDGTHEPSTYRLRTKGYIPVKPNTTYRLSGTGLILIACRAYSSSKALTRSIGDITESAFTTNSDEYFIRLYISKDESTTMNPIDILNTKLQLEHGTIATPYEPYKESTVYINGAGELRSLPNGTKDEVRLSDGKMIKRVSQMVINDSDIITMRTSFNNLDYVNVTKPEDYLYYDKWSGNDERAFMLENHGSKPTNSPSNLDDTKWIGYIDSAGASTDFYVGVPKGTTLEQARQQLAGLTLTYQLAQEEIIPIEVYGTLNSYPSGTVILENIVPDSGIYTDKMSVLHQDLPIKALEKISKVDFDTGLETELDITAAIIAEDKLSFTHPDLTSGDIVFFVYEHGAEGTIPETEISYYDSRYVIKGEDDKFYQWEIEAKLVEGVITPSIKLVEV